MHLQRARSRITRWRRAALREKLSPDTEVVDLNHEVHYDDNNGDSINNLRVVFEAAWKIFGPVRRVPRLEIGSPAIVILS